MNKRDNYKLEVGAESMQLFGPAFVEQFLVVAKPVLEVMIRDVVDEGRSASDVLCVPYEVAGKMIGTSYEGVRKLVRKGVLESTSRGRRRVISVAELKSYVERNKVVKQ